MNVVIPAPQSRERNLALKTLYLGDSSSPAAPRNDRLDGFFGILLMPCLLIPSMPAQKAGVAMVAWLASTLGSCLPASEPRGAVGALGRV